MRRRSQGSQDSQADSQDMGRSADNTGSTGSGATSTGMQDTGGTYQQQSGGVPQQQGSRTEATTGYGRGQAPERADYGASGYRGRPATSRHGAALSILAGALAFLEGLAFVIRSHFYHAVPGYAYRWNLHGWGWVLLILGALLIAGGVSHFLGIKGSRHFTAAIAVITAVVAFITLFYSIVWGIIVLAASGFAAHALLSDRHEERYAAGDGGARGETYQGGSQRGSDDQAMSGQGGRSQRV
jgi:hypothetical protein